jgi:anti-sigma factor ChrR (cupin superfamily)
MAVLRFDLTPFLKMDLCASSLASLSWKELGEGLSIARLATEGKATLLLYRIQESAGEDAFRLHEHLEGEFYLVLQGEIQDEFGRYRKGEIVYLGPKSRHLPRAIGETVVLVLWPGGIRMCGEDSADD